MLCTCLYLLPDNRKKIAATEIAEMFDELDELPLSVAMDSAEMSHKVCICLLMYITVGTYVFVICLQRYIFCIDFGCLYPTNLKKQQQIWDFTKRFLISDIRNDVTINKTRVIMWGLKRLQHVV